MKFKVIIPLATIAIITAATGCHNSTTTADSGVSITPEAGGSYKSGDAVAVQAHLPSSSKPDSIVYLVDSVRVGVKKDTAAFQLKTAEMPLGPRILTARVYEGGKPQEASTNIVLLPAKAPEEYTYKIIKTFPHDTSTFTEGLLYQDGYLYESGGGYLKPPPDQIADGQSSIRKVDLNTGKTVLKTMVDPKVFAEGIAIVGDKLIQMTYHEKIGYVYDKNTLKLLNTFTNNVGVEGWGMCSDGNKLYFDDSTNRLYFLDKNNYHQTGYVDVYDDKGPVKEINELEYIDGKIYANIWKTDTIIAIDPKTGAVLQRINLSSLYPEASRTPPADVLNGIAYDAAGKRIFITGKKWPKLYQVEFVKK